MLKKRLIIVNSVIIVLSVLSLCIVTVSGFRRLFYRESTLIYDAQLEKSYSMLENTFNSAQNLSLNVCVDPGLQSVLQDFVQYSDWDDAMSAEFDRVLADTAKTNTTSFTISVFPVTTRGDVLIKDADGLYTKSGMTKADYKMDYGFLWQFRPNNSDTIRITRKIYDANDATKVLGIVTVDLSVLNISEIFWLFSARTDISGKLYLLDENDELLLPYSSQQVELTEYRVSSLESVSYELRGERITVYRSFIQNRWKLVGIIDGSSLLSGSKSLIENICWIGAAFAAVGIILIILMADRLTSPILKLARWMRKSTESGSYNRINNDPWLSGETRILYDTYNNLMDIVNRSIKEIRDAGEREVKNEFLLLQSQINPHFLYNTLDSMGWMAMQHGAMEIRDMTIYLAGMFRNSLNKGKPLIRVDNEVEQVRCYLNIMMMRYPDTYSAEYDIEDGVEGYLIIKQILQPLVENALQHGFYGGNKKGFIRISAHRQGGELVLSVENDGEPADIGKIERLLAGDASLQSKHYGIRNVDERLRKLYGDESGLRFSNEKGLTVVVIRLPLDKLTEDEEQ